MHILSAWIGIAICSIADKLSDTLLGRLMPFSNLERVHSDHRGLDYIRADTKIICEFLKSYELRPQGGQRSSSDVRNHQENFPFSPEEEQKNFEYLSGYTLTIEIVINTCLVTPLIILKVTPCQKGIDASGHSLAFLRTALLARKTMQPTKVT